MTGEQALFSAEKWLTSVPASTPLPFSGTRMRTREGRLSAQFEHAVAVTAGGVEVLTLREGETALA